MPGRVRIRSLKAAIVFLAAGLAATPAAAADIVQRYDVTIRGLRAATMELAVNTTDSSYTARAMVRSSGVVGVFSSFAIGGTSTGRILPGGVLEPVRYDGIRNSDTPQKTRMIYRGGTPVSVAFDPARPPRERDAPPQEQSGTLDPVSAAFHLLADAPVGKACGRSVEVYDGMRRSRLTIEPRRETRHGWVCSGTYTRVAGFTPKQMREKVNFPFSIHYAEVGGIMQVTRFEVDSILGPAVATRR